MPASTQQQLRPLQPSQLRAGMALPGHLRDATGRVLMFAGELLTAADLVRLADQDLHAGADWPDQSWDQQGPAHVMKALAEQAQSAAGLDNRAHPRHRWSAVLALTVEESTDQFTSQRQIKVTTGDLSAGGFSFVHRQYIHLGTIVTACFEALRQRPTLSGVVRSCIATDGGRYRVGVQFTEIQRRRGG